MDEIRCYVVLPRTQHQQSFILLHGLGSDGQTLGQELMETAVTSSGASLPDLFPAAKFFFPTAKKRRSSAFNRAMLTQWFDTASESDGLYRKETQYQGLAESAQALMAIIEQEKQAVGADNIVLGGISRGCAMGMALLLSLERRVAAFIGMSGWLPFHDDLLELAQQNKDDAEYLDVFTSGSGAQDDGAADAFHFQRELLQLDDCPMGDAFTTPVYLGHGELDDKVSIDRGRKMRDTAQALGFAVTWKSYPDLGHWYKVPDEIDDIVAFLKRYSNLRTTG